MNWKTKPSDRFVLRFIKLWISAPISQFLLRIQPDIRPATITITSAVVGIGGGVAFGLGFAWLGGLLAACSQVMDGIDGQIARLTGRESPEGAMLDSVLDRYMDFSLMFGIFFHCLYNSTGMGKNNVIVSPGWLVLIAALAVAGSSQVSYSTARAASLNLPFKRPEHAGKGSRMTVIILCGLLTPLWIHFPLVALMYLALHPNIGVILSMYRLKIRK
jgi:phosphatidylglycerophosphate synthase